jgi:AraC-like DNA-binding protein
METLTPASALQPFVIELCGVSFCGAERASFVPPDACAALVVRGVGGGPPGVFVRGPSTRAGRFPRGDLRWAAGVQLRPGSARRLLGVPLDVLTDALVPLEELWGAQGHALAAAVAGAGSLRARLDALETALLKRLSFVGATGVSAPRSVRRALALLERAPMTNVADLAAEIGLSARQLRRHFNEWVGIGPKEAAAVLRFQRAAEALAVSRAPSCAAIALEAGYYDQAHMNLDFRRRTGMTPSTWAVESR